MAYLENEKDVFVLKKMEIVLAHNLREVSLFFIGCFESEKQFRSCSSTFHTSILLLLLPLPSFVFLLNSCSLPLPLVLLEVSAHYRRFAWLLLGKNRSGNGSGSGSREIMQHIEWWGRKSY